ncbi:MAG: hypothetical protein HFI57_07680 [Lachnospiraceae bacterium]|nr:hypothetical protein [Lachnospiraceae bacterium]
MYQKEIIYLGLYKDGSRMGSAGFLKVENRNRESRCYLKVQNLPLSISGRFPIRVYSGTGWKEINGIAIQDGGGNWEDNLPENIDRAMIQVMLSGGYVLEGKSKSALDMPVRKITYEPQNFAGQEKGGEAQNKKEIENVNTSNSFEAYGNTGGSGNVEYQENTDEPGNVGHQVNMDRSGNAEYQENVDGSRNVEYLENADEPGNAGSQENVDRLGNAGYLENTDESGNAGYQVNVEKSGDMPGTGTADKARQMSNPGSAGRTGNLSNPGYTDKTGNLWNPGNADKTGNLPDPDNIDGSRDLPDPISADMGRIIETGSITAWGNAGKAENMEDSGNNYRTQNMPGSENLEKSDLSENMQKIDTFESVGSREKSGKANEENSYVSWGTSRMERINHSREKIQTDRTQKDTEELHNRESEMNTYETRKEIKSWNIGNSWRTQNHNTDRSEQTNRQPQTIIITEELPRQTQADAAAVTYNTQEYSVKEDKWEQILDTYENIHPYGDERVYVKLEPKDFVILQSKYQHLVNNSFLLHGFYNYRYVILGKEEDYYLGVPGVFYEREKMVALMFGFEAFECPGGTVRAGEFGYYLRKVEL